MYNHHKKTKTYSPDGCFDTKLTVKMNFCAYGFILPNPTFPIHFYILMYQESNMFHQPISNCKHLN